MRKILVALFAMLFLVGGSASIVAAQSDATPAAGSEASSGSNPIDPKIGDTVTYFDENGDPAGTATVSSRIGGSAVSLDANAVAQR